MIEPVVVGAYRLRYHKARNEYTVELPRETLAPRGFRRGDEVRVSILPDNPNVLLLHLRKDEEGIKKK